MRYANAIVTEYQNSEYVNIAVFNRIIVDDFTLKSAPVKLDRKDLDQKKIDKLDSECLRISVMRAKHKIFDIALSNKWQLFVTFTFNDRIVNGYDFEKCMEKVKRWTQNAVKRQGLRYLLVPELHPSSGRIHLHGLLFYEKFPNLVFSGHYDRNRRPIYNLSSWKYGYSTVIQLSSNSEDKISRYITKYSTKEIGKITGNFYYAGGRGLNRKVDKQYLNVDYDMFEGNEYNCFGDMKVKYLIITKEQLLKLQFIEVDNID